MCMSLNSLRGQDGGEAIEGGREESYPICEERDEERGLTSSGSGSWSQYIVHLLLWLATNMGS